MSRNNIKKQIILRLPITKAGLVTILATVLAINGCVTCPTFVKPQTKLNDDWSQKGDPRVSTQNTINSQWWTTFKDPVLDKLIQLAFEQNLTLQMAGLRIVESRARLGIAIGQQYPQTQEVFGSMSNDQRSKNSPNGAAVDRYNWDYQTGFDAVWELDFWGKYRRGVEVETANWTASVANYDYALVSLTAEVARTYTIIRTYEALILLADENIKVQQEGLQIAQSRFNYGATTELDVTQARTLLESTRASVPKLEISLKLAQDALSTLLGLPAGNVVSLLEGAKDIPTAPAEVSVSIPADMLRRRPDVRNAELYAAAQCARIGIAKADFYPSISLFGEVGFETSSRGGATSSNAQFHNLFDSGSIFFSYGPSFKWPILNYGRIANNVRVQDARFQESIANYQHTVLQSVQEVEDALTGFLKSQEATIYEQNSVDAAKRSVEIAMTQYREGATDYERVLDSQRSLLQQQNNLTQSRSSIATNLIALYKSLGGGWELRKGKAIVSSATIAEMKSRTDWGKMLPVSVPEELPEHKPVREIPLLQPVDW